MPSSSTPMPLNPTRGCSIGSAKSTDLYQRRFSPLVCWVIPRIVRPGFVIGRMTDGMKPTVVLSTTPTQVARAVAVALLKNGRTVWVPRAMSVVAACPWNRGFAIRFGRGGRRCQ